MSPRKVTVRGRIGPKVDDARVEFIAAAPPDSRASFSGSGLPFANSMQAFGSTKTKGDLELSNTQEFEVTIDEPNSYYVNLGSTLIEPSIYVRYKTDNVYKTERFTVGSSIAYRTLTYPTLTEVAVRDSPEFYKMSQEVDARTQEQILNDSEYTGHYQDKFWGITPPL
jgi:hypothetical protein